MANEKKNQEKIFINLFADSESSYRGSFRVPEDITKGLDKFFRAKYENQRLWSANGMCYNMFVQKVENKKKIIYIGLFSPWQTNRELHIERAHYVAVIHRQDYHLNLMIQEITEQMIKRSLFVAIFVTQRT